MHISNERLQATYILGINTTSIINSVNVQDSLTDIEQWLIGYPFENEIAFLQLNNRVDEIRLIKNIIAEGDLKKLKNKFFEIQQDIIDQKTNKNSLIMIGVVSVSVIFVIYLIL